MRDDSLMGRTMVATIGFAMFIVLFTLVRDALGGQPLSIVGPAVSGVVGAVVYGTIYYLMMRRRSRVNGA